MTGAGVASATFPGSANGNIAFTSICDGNIGQAIYSLNPNGSPPPTYTCPGGTAPNYTQSTAGSTDSMPYFSPDGSTLYFASNRLSVTAPFAIYKVAYPATITGSAGSQVDGAVQLTNPVNEDDYAPTVSADGTKLAFIRCNSSGACSLEVQSPIVGGTPTAVSTAVAPAGTTDATTGAADRPEFNPVDSSQIIYVGTDGHIHLVSLTGAFPERDLSLESGITSGFSDEYPDWSPSGSKIIFDSNRSGGHTVWTLNVTTTPATASRVWASDPGAEIEPIYAPNGTDYAWTVLGKGSNLQLDIGVSVNNPVEVVNLTSNKTNNSQPTWQPIQLVAQTPEAPLTIALPFAGAAILFGFGIFSRRRNRMTDGSIA